MRETSIRKGPPEARSGGGTRALREDRIVDVIVPVCGAANDLARCLGSVRSSSGAHLARLLIVLDGPQDEAVHRAVKEGAEGLDGEILTISDRQGFVRAANRGIRASDRDVVLLNSDTVVTPGWLGKLHAAAYSRPAVGTVTPLSNNATICSVPRFLEENEIPAGYTIEAFGRLVEHVAAREYPRLPTGVGFCLYLRRALLDEVGLFDERRFGTGYGEENDLCLRASARGWEHVADDATFVYHRGGSSFGGAHAGLRRRRMRTLETLHPGWTSRLAAFLRDDTLVGVRERIVRALDEEAGSPAANTSSRGRRIVHVVHGWPPYAVAGTETYAASLARWQAGHHRVTVLARTSRPDRRFGDAIELWDRGVRVRLVVNDFTSRNPLVRNALDSRLLRRAFRRLIEEERPDLVHVHHLSGHCATLPLVARRMGVPVLWQLQDWWAPCARANLFHRDGFLCSGPGLAKCSDCLPLTRVRPRSIWNPLLYALRAALLRRALAAASSVVAGSRFVVESYRALGWLAPGAPVEVCPYGIAPLGRPARSRPPGDTLRVGFVGSLMPHKGAHVLAAAVRSMPAGSVEAEIWGDPAADPAYAAMVADLGGERVVLRGRFADDEKARVLGGLDLLVVPSVGLESYGIVAREAHTIGLPALVADRGALAEIDGGLSFPAGDVEALRERLAGLARDRSELAEVASRLPRPPTLDEHARSIDRVYEDLLAPGGEP